MLLGLKKRQGLAVLAWIETNPMPNICRLIGNKLRREPFFGFMKTWAFFGGPRGVEPLEKTQVLGSRRVLKDV